jgi:cytochrome o ubiquinol oxidase subunit II
MRFMVHAVAAAEFQDWLARTRAQGGSLDSDAFAQLARVGVLDSSQTYGSVDPALFQQIMQPQVP